MQETDDVLIRLAELALKDYDIGLFVHVQPLKTTFNGVFKIVAQDKTRYVLRISAPDGHSVQEVHSELMWLNALSQSSRDLFVPVPVLTKQGQLFTTIQLPLSEQIRPVVLFKWVEGQRIGTPLTAHQATLIAGLSATMHQFSETFTPPEGFRRRKFDRIWFYGKPGNAFPEERQQLFQDATDLLQDLLQEEVDNISPARLIHADIHQGNCLFTEQGGVNLIDFDDLCWGHFAQDVATTLFHFQSIADDGHYDVLYSAYRAGYEAVRPWPEQYDGQIAAWIVIRELVVGSYIYASTNDKIRAMMAWWPDVAEKRLRNWLNRR